MGQEIIRLATPAIYGGRANIIASPFQFLFAGEDHIRLVVANSQPGVVVRWSGRFQPMDGTLQVFDGQMTPAADRTVSAIVIQMGVGFLLNLALSATSGFPLIGQTYAQARIQRGFGAAFDVFGNLLGGYFNNRQFLSYPGSPVQSSIEGGGYLRTITGTMPGAGNEISEAVPTGARWELVTTWAALSASGAAGARRIVLRLITSGGQPKCYAPAPGTIAPSTNGHVSFGQGFPSDGSAGADGLMQALPQNQTLLAGDFITTVTTNLDVGDGYFTPILSVREWLEVA